MIALVATLLLGQVVLKEEGVTVGAVNSINCTGGLVTCSRVGSAGTLEVGSPDGGSVTTVSVVTANGVSGSVATPTTTPAITLTLGAITPSSVAAAGAVSGSNLSGTNTGDQTETCGASTFVSTIAAGTGSTCTQPAFTDLSGSATLAQNGTGAGAPSADDQVIVSASGSATSWAQLVDCDGATKALNYRTASNSFACNTFSSSGYATIQDEGSGLTQRTTLNFVGAVSCVDDTTRTTCTVSGGSPLTTKGDLYTFTTVDARKAVGADGLCLKANSAEATGLEWAACSAGGGISYAEAAAAVMGGF